MTTSVWMYIYDEGLHPYGHKRSYSVGNYDGSQRYPITGWKSGKHNWTSGRVDFWFEKDGSLWHGTQYDVKSPSPNWHCVTRPKTTKRVKAKYDGHLPYDMYRLRDF